LYQNTGIIEQEPLTSGTVRKKTTLLHLLLAHHISMMQPLHSEQLLTPQHHKPITEEYTKQHMLTTETSAFGEISSSACGTYMNLSTRNTPIRIIAIWGTAFLGVMEGVEVWVCKGEVNSTEKCMDAEQWHQVGMGTFGRRKEKTVSRLKLDKPVEILANETVGMVVHSGSHPTAIYGICLTPAGEIAQDQHLRMEGFGLTEAEELFDYCYTSASCKALITGSVEYEFM
jgi:hypothetical protein